MTKPSRDMQKDMQHQEFAGRHRINYEFSPHSLVLGEHKGPNLVLRDIQKKIPKKNRVSLSLIMTFLYSVLIEGNVLLIMHRRPQQFPRSRWRRMWRQPPEQTIAFGSPMRC
jgi:hypothetical protein